MLEPGEQVDRYVVERELGSGGMATVYCARHVSLHDRRVALKLLHPHLSRQPEVVERFVAEARLQSRLQSPHILAVWDIVTWRGAPVLIMDWIHGGSLADALDRDTPFPLREVLDLADQLLAGLEVAHEAGVVHRDLKPDNVLLARSADGGLRAILSDFGIAKLLDRVATATRTGALMGTLAYMSPEQIEDASRVDARSDLYSLGVVLWELLSGRHPYDAHLRSNPELILVVSRGELGELPPSIPSPVRAWMAELTAREVARRFASARAARRALARVRAQIPSDTGRLTPTLVPGERPTFPGALAEADTLPPRSERPLDSSVPRGPHVVPPPPLATPAPDVGALPPPVAWDEDEPVSGPTRALSPVGDSPRTRTMLAVADHPTERAEAIASATTAEPVDAASASGRAPSPRAGTPPEAPPTEPLSERGGAQRRSMRRGLLALLALIPLLVVAACVVRWVWARFVDDESPVAAVAPSAEGSGTEPAPGQPPVAALLPRGGVDGAGSTGEVSPGATSASAGEAAPCPAGFVAVEPAEFVVGAPPGELGRGNLEVQREARVSRGFCIMTTEVTQGEWMALLGTNPSRFPACGPACPVESVTWFGAVTYANRRSEAEGRTPCYGPTGEVEDGQAWLACDGYRLPTQVEWELAARAGHTGATWAGDLVRTADRTAPALSGVATYSGNSDVAWAGGVDCSSWSGRERPGRACGPAAVASRAPNPLGLYDMLGNVAEWTNDWMGKDFAPATDPQGPPVGVERVVRGGSWSSFPEQVRLAAVRGQPPSDRSADVGFRLVRGR